MKVKNIKIFSIVLLIFIFNLIAPNLSVNASKNDSKYDLTVSYGIDGKYIFSNMSALPEEPDFDEREDDRISFQICEKDEEHYIFVCDYVSQGGNSMYLITQTDISSVINAQN